MNIKQETQKDSELVRFIQFLSPKSTIFINTTNKAAQGQGNGGKPAHAYMGKKADSPRNFLEKILKLVAILLWIIVGLNLIITILIYKIFFQ